MKRMRASTCLFFMVPVLVFGCSSTDNTPDEGVSGDATASETAVDVPGDDGPVSNCVDGFCPAGPEHAPDPLGWGPYPVGVRTATFEDTNPDNLNEDGLPRVLVTEIWYPTTEAFRDAPQYVYDPEAEAPKDLLFLFEDLEAGTLKADAVRDADVRAADGPYPLVIFSHGAFAIRYQSVFFTARLASHGYVVISPDHQNNTIWDMLRSGFDREGLGFSAWHRPFDTIHLVDRMKDWNTSTDNEFHGVMDMDHVGVSGHSFGGYTSTAALCQIPEVKAIAAMAPAAEMTFLSGCAPHDLPGAKMIMGGLLDNTLTYQSSFKGPWDVMTAPKWMLTLARGGHYTFSDMCRFNLVEITEKTGYPDAAEALNDGCGEEHWDFEEAQEAINLYAIALFNMYLRDSPGSAQYLTPQAGADFGDEIELLAVPGP